MKSSSTKLSLFAAAPPGLENETLRELFDLGIEGVLEPGGVAFSGGLRELYLANLWLRTAHRILVRVASLRVTRLSGLAPWIARYPWEVYLSPSRSLGIRVTCRRSRLYHSGAIGQRILEGIEGRLGTRLATDSREPRQTVVARIVRDRLVVSVDSSGEHLHKRGYRLAQGRAPVREVLAAAMLLRSGWRGGVSLWDPMCGSGTVVIEGAMIAANMAPGLNREFAFEEWRNFNPVLWHGLRDEAGRAARPPRVPITGSDKDERGIEKAVENARRAGVGDVVDFRASALEELAPMAPGTTGLVATNPPYGRRLIGKKGAPEFYEALGSGLIRAFGGWKVVMLCGSKHLAKKTGLPLESLGLLDNGGLKVSLLMGRIPADYKNDFS